MSVSSVGEVKTPWNMLICSFTKAVGEIPADQASVYQLITTTSALLIWSPRKALQIGPLIESSLASDKRAYLILHTWILGQCGIRYHWPMNLSNLEASELAPRCWISGQKCCVTAFHHVRCILQKLLSLTELTSLNYNSWSHDRCLDCMLKVLQHHCVYHSDTWSCHL